MRKESLAVALLLVTAAQAQIIHTETQEVLGAKHADVMWCCCSTTPA